MSFSYKQLVSILSFTFLLINVSLSQNTSYDSLAHITIFGNDCSKSAAYCDLAYLYVDSLPDLSAFYAQKALYYSEKCGNSQNISFANIMLGTNYLLRSNYNSAIEYFTNAEKIALQDSNYQQLHTIYNNLGIIFKNLNNNFLAIKYYSKGLDYSYLCNDKQAIIQSLINLANINYINKNYEKSLNLYFQALKTCNENPKETEYEISTIFNNIATILFESGEFSKAEYYWNKALDFFIRNDLYYYQAIIYNNLFELKFKQNNISQAEKYLQMAEMIFDKYDYLESQKNLHLTAYELYKYISNFEKALYHYEKSMDISRNIVDIELRKIIEDMNAKYKLDSIKTELKSQALILKHKETREKYIKTVTIFLLVIILLLFYIVLSNKLNIKRLNKLNYKINIALREIESNLEYSENLLTKLKLPDRNNFKYKYFVFDRPKMQIGGDFYYCESNADSSYFILGDSTGHGVSAAFLTVVSLTNIKRLISENKNPAEILNYVNNIFCQISDSSKANESLCLTITRIRGNILEYAGSKQRMWKYKSNSEQIEEYKTDNQIIGLDKSYVFNLYFTDILSSDQVFLSSDGFVDQFNHDSTEKIKYKRFKEILKECSSLEIEKQAEFLENFLEKWKGSNEQTDDILVAGIKI
ncbi:MAG TPA: SpoIIE family protein phosphatase [Bacteroidales bacterium]|nr:SpoIIE family protein phosphatase [Bacteroidales bacterium]HOL97354.1 SpoIIE family protein phosphatase [Bacteroidales bacterium]HUM31689.1 SpoIIE family protein phosphatase [Bacteroidales bacterium]